MFGLIFAHLHAVTYAGEANTLRVDISRDTWVSSYQQEADANLGGKDTLKLKSHQEFSIVDIDTAALRGRVITGATLHLHSRSRDILGRVTVSSLASDWVEGTSRRYEPQAGAASFNWSKQNIQRWAYAASDVTAVSLGVGNTIWSFADATPPDARGYQAIAVDPRVVAARVATLSHGFVLYDDVGSEYTRDEDRFIQQLYPNRFVSSRDAGKTRTPYFTITLGERDEQPPDAVDQLTQLDTPLPATHAMVTWRTPADNGPAGVLGFDVRWMHHARFDWDRATNVPRYLIAMASAAGESNTLHVRDLPVNAGDVITLGIRAVDAAGNAGPVQTLRVKMSDHKPLVLPELQVRMFDKPAPLPRVGPLSVSVIDELDKLNPVTGGIIPSRPDNYRSANHLWSAAEKRIRLFAGRNEFVSFQLVLSGQARDVNVSAKFDADDGASQPVVRLLRSRHVKTKMGSLPDPVVPASPAMDIPAGDESIAGQRHASIFVEIYVPHEARAGLQAGEIVIEHNGVKLALPIELHVWQFTLPDYLSFVPQMNSYGLPEPPVEVEYYRLAHEHRTCLNRLPYNWRGSVEAVTAPRWNGRELDFTDYDARFGPLLDGSAFDDLPRKGVPVDAFYLPLNENWPANIHDAFLGGYWIERAFRPGYRETFVQASRQFAAHFARRGWTDTMFEFYLNNKIYHKHVRGSWFGSSAPWIFDEPAHTQDFWAVRWFGIAFHEGVAAARNARHDAPAGVKMLFRADISRPQWQRDLLDGVLDVNVVGEGFRQYQRMIHERARRDGQLVYNYGSSNPIEASNVQPAGWCLDTWTLGADGVLPWQTIGNANSWRRADTHALFYPGEHIGQQGPIPSLRLKAYRRGQQDVEYLTIFTQITDEPRWAVADAVRRELGLQTTLHQTSAEDAGTIEFTRLDPVDLWRLRTRIGFALDELQPPARRKWLDLRPPARDVTTLPALGHVPN